MPKGKSKKFIDKKNSVTFHLVHRSQQDPLIADESAPQRVLVQAGDVQSKKHEKKTLDKEERIKEQKKFGVYFDDDYDYLKHLKDVRTLATTWERVETKEESGEKKDSIPKRENINLPSSVFESDVQEKIGLLNKAAPISGPQLQLDPEVIAALDEDFDFDDPDNILEDNFIELANQPAGSGNEEDDFDSDAFYDEEDDEDFSDEEDDEVHSLNSPQHTFKNEETKSRFTEYSVSSSVMKRNEQLSLLDDKFERMFMGYDDNEIGALDCEEIEGVVEPDSDVVMQHLSEFQKEQEVVEDLNKPSKDILNRFISDSEDENDIKLEKLVIDEKAKEKWDCESYLSTYSNIYNHPKLISDRKDHQIKIDSKTGIPTNVIDGRDNTLTSRNLLRLQKSRSGVSDEVASIRTTNTLLHLRAKDETPEQRKERKQTLKEHKRERRQERKANILAFKDEKKRQEKILMNRKNNTHGDRIL